MIREHASYSRAANSVELCHAGRFVPSPWLRFADEAELDGTAPQEGCSSHKPCRLLYVHAMVGQICEKLRILKQAPHCHASVACQCNAGATPLVLSLLISSSPKFEVPRHLPPCQWLRVVRLGANMCQRLTNNCEK